MSAVTPFYVIPAKAGIHCLTIGVGIAALDEWIPAFAGMTSGWGINA